jgi:hypothetical protein
MISFIKAGCRIDGMLINMPMIKVLTYKNKKCFLVSSGGTGMPANFLTGLVVAALSVIFSPFTSLKVPGAG